MAQEITVAREGSVNPINAIRGRGETAADFRESMKKEGWSVRKVGNGTNVKATANIPVQVDGKERRFLLSVYYDEKKQDIIGVEGSFMDGRTAFLTPSELGGIEGGNVVEKAKSLKSMALKNKSKVLDEAIKRNHSPKRERRTTTPKSVRRTSQPPAQRQTRESLM